MSLLECQSLEVYMVLVLMRARMMQLRVFVGVRRQKTETLKIVFFRPDGTPSRIYLSIIMEFGIQALSANQ